MISSVKPRSFNFKPVITFAASLARGRPIALLTNGTVREARGVHLQDVDGLVLHRELDVHEALDAEGLRHLDRGGADLLLHFFREGGRGDDAGPSRRSGRRPARCAP